jgi:hypothetical protein
MIVRTLILFFLALVAFSLSCSQKNAIVGYWQWGDVQSFWEFRADGVCQTHGAVASKVNGHYSFLSWGKLKIDISGDTQPKIVFVSIKGDEMTFTENKFSMKFHRVDPSKIEPITSFDEEIFRRLRWSSPATNQPSNPKR